MWKRISVSEDDLNKLEYSEWKVVHRAVAHGNPNMTDEEHEAAHAGMKEGPWDNHAPIGEGNG